MIVPQGFRMKSLFVQRLDETAARLPDKLAYASPTDSLTYAQLRDATLRVGSCLAKYIQPRQAVAVLMGREVQAVAGILGVNQAGGITAPLDPTMPAERMLKVFQTLRPACILADDNAKKLVEDLQGSISCPVVWYKDANATEINMNELMERRDHMSQMDPAELFYTSGSTGLPKGAVYTNRNLLQYTDRCMDYTDIVNENIVCGNQAPFFYANALNDVHLAIALGCTVWLIPEPCFKFPTSFVEFVNEKKITTLIMTPLNYVYIADSGILTPGSLPTLKSYYLSGEVVTYDKIKIWMAAAPNATCFNIYGSTETPYSAQYALGDREFELGEVIPVGPPIRDSRIVLVDENGDQVPQGQVGEVYTCTPWMTLGYYNDPERTAQSYRRDPMGLGWDQTWYRTGDLGQYNDKGELLILGRSDTQIKHRGFRMDIGEVEAAMRTTDGWQNGCCLFDEKEDLLYCFWTGTLDEAALKASLGKKLEKYMQPNRWVYLPELPRTSSGKLDRMALKAEYFGK